MRASRVLAFLTIIIIACEGRGSVDDGNDSPGTAYSLCVNGRIQVTCCSAPADCNFGSGGFCDLGGGACSDAPCARDAAADSDADAGAGETPCGATSCKGGDVCVITTTPPGACQRPDDGGVCANGEHVSASGWCDPRTTSYACKPLPSSCGGTLPATFECGCALSICDCGAGTFFGCQHANASNTLDCVCQPP